MVQVVVTGKYSDDLTFNGSGSLSVTGKNSDAIKSNKGIKFVKGTVTIPNAVQKGIKAIDSVCINDGSIINVNSIFLKLPKKTDPEKAHIVIDGGKITISTKKEGIHAEIYFTVKGGSINIKESEEGMEGQMVDILGSEHHIIAAHDGIYAARVGNITDLLAELMPIPEDRS